MKLEKDTDSYGFKRLKNEISKKIGVDYDNYSNRHLRRRFHARMRVVDTPKFSDYLNYLKKNEKEEIEKLRDLLTVNVTKFKRDIEVWKIIEGEVVPDLLNKDKTGLNRIRAWSAGCATGEEPYSLSICYLKNKSSSGPSFKITATDLDSEALTFAKRGEYPDKSLKNLSRTEKRDFFNDVDGGWKIKEKVKRQVDFKKKDIFKTRFTQKFDFISCRNLMIYFNNEAKTKLMERLVESLRPGGYLVIGMSENLRAPAKDKVKAYNLRKRVFLKE